MRTFCNRAPKEKGAMQTLYFNQKQTQELLEISDLALILMQHYVAISYQPNPNMEDAVVAKILGKAPKTIERTRLSLTRKGWFKRTKTSVNGEPHIMYSVGKQAVNKGSVNSAYVDMGEAE